MEILSIAQDRKKRTLNRTLSKIFDRFCNTPNKKPLVTIEETLPIGKSNTDKNNERYFDRSLRDWINNSELSVAVTGAVGSGKSKLINTLLEATVTNEEEYFVETTHSEPYKQSEYEFCCEKPSSINDGEDDKDLKWLQNVSNKKHLNQFVKYYSKVTSYSFEGDDDFLEDGNIGFSVSDFIEEEIMPDPDISQNKENLNIPPTTYKGATLYIWDNPDKTPKKEYDCEIFGTIDGYFTPDEEFIQSIDWEKEKLSIESQPYLSDDLDDTRSFLLPQGPNITGCIAPQTFILRYGKKLSVIVSFPTENETRQALWKLHECFSGKIPISLQHLAILNKRYHIMLGLDDHVDIPLSHITSMQDFQFTLENKKLLGKKFCFSGLGKDLHHDRVYIREKIKEIVSKYGYHMVKFYVRVPCSVLEGNKELIEVSGSLEDGMNTQLAIQNANLLMVTVDRNDGLSPDLAKVLNTSGIAEKFLTKRYDRKAIFLDLHNNGPKTIPADILEYHHGENFNKFRERLLLQWRQLINSSIPTHPPIDSNTFSQRNIERVISDSLVLHTDPTLFTSIHLRDNFPKELLKGLNVRQVLNATSIPTILSVIPNRQLVKCTMQLKELHRKFLSENKYRYSSKLPRGLFPKEIDPGFIEQLRLSIHQPIGHRSRNPKKRKIHSSEEFCSFPPIKRFVTSSTKISENTHDHPLSNFGKEREEESNSEKTVHVEHVSTTLNQKKENFEPHKTPQKPVEIRSEGSSSSVDSQIRTEDVISEKEFIPRQRRQFFQQLRRDRVDIKQVTKDGNSQFRALAHQVYGTESAHTIVRLLVVSEILHNSTRYTNYLNNTGINLEEYCLIISREGCFGDHLTLNAFANFYGVNVLLYSPSYSHPLLIQSIRPTSNSDVLRIAYTGSNFYHSVVSPEERNRKRQNELNSESENRCKKRRRKNKNSTTTTNTVKISCNGPNSLEELCLDKVVENLENLSPTLEGLLPREVLQKIISTISAKKKLSDSNLEPLLDPSMTSITISDTARKITDLSLYEIARKCKNLNSLELINCVRITSKGIIQIAQNCTELDQVNLEGCSGIRNIAIQELARKCPNIVSVNITSCVQITDIALQELLLACPSIRTIITRNCNQLTDSALHYLGKKTSVLDISECEQFSDKTLFTVSTRCPRLKSIRLNGRNITDLGITAMAKTCTALAVLEITGCNSISNAAVNTLARQCPHLEELNLDSCRGIDDEAFTVGSEGRPTGFKVLKSLNLAKCISVGDKGICALLKNCNYLQHLVMASCETITDVAIMAVAQYCNRLLTIDLSNCGKLTDTSLKALAVSCTNLLKVNLYNCNKITDATMSIFAKNCSNLRSIDISCCDILTDDTLNSITVGCPKLEKLYLEECKMSSNGLEQLTRCHNLRCLKLGYSKGFNDKVFERLVEACPKISEIDLSYCNKLSPQALVKFLKKWFGLTVLNLRGYQSELDQIHHTHLENLNLSWCKNVDDVTVGSIANGCPNLVGLDLAWSTKITGNAVHKLAATCSCLRSLNLRGCARVSIKTIQYLSGSNSMVIYH